MILPGLNVQRIELPLIDADHHLYRSVKFFTNSMSSSYSQEVIATATAMTLSEARKIIEKVHNYGFCHSTFADMKVILPRNGVWY